MNPSGLQGALDSGEIIQLPLFATRFVMIHSMPNMEFDDKVGLILDMNIMSLIWQGNNPFLFQFNNKWNGI
jgi:hypothetical protein